MLHDRHAVLREHDILFEVVGPLGVGQGLGGQRVFRQVAAGAAVGDDERRGLGGGERAEGADDEREGYFHAAGAATAGMNRRTRTTLTAPTEAVNPRT